MIFIKQTLNLLYLVKKVCLKSCNSIIQYCLASSFYVNLNSNFPPLLFFFLILEIIDYTNDFNMFLLSQMPKLYRTVVIHSGKSIVQNTSMIQIYYYKTNIWINY